MPARGMQCFAILHNSSERAYGRSVGNFSKYCAGLLYRCELDRPSCAGTGDSQSCWGWIFAAVLQGPFWSLSVTKPWDLHPTGLIIALPLSYTSGLQLSPAFSPNIRFSQPAIPKVLPPHSRFGLQVTAVIYLVLKYRHLKHHKVSTECKYYIW